MNPAQEQVLALTSGLPPHAREGWFMITLQPYVDDSGSEPQSHTFVLGGLIAQPAEWLAFSADWQTVLDSGPVSLDYFKMSEAMSRKGQFDRSRGWTRALRDKKVDEFIEVICKRVPLAAWVSTRHADFQKYLQSIPMPQRHLSTDTPYMFLYPQFVFALGVFAQRLRADCVFDIIFDEQVGFDREAVLAWPGIKIFADSVGLGRYLAGAPAYRDEKRFLPLQGADLFAWEHRKHLEKNRALIVGPTSRWRRLNTVRTFSMQFTADRLREMHGPLFALMADFAADNNPDAEMLPAGKHSRRLTKAALKRGDDVITRKPPSSRRLRGGQPS
jgi:hypothetical protein